MDFHFSLPPSTPPTLPAPSKPSATLVQATFTEHSTLVKK